jgi:hypothetical protein
MIARNPQLGIMPEPRSVMDKEVAMGRILANGPVRRCVGIVNSGVTALVDAPGLGGLVGKYMTTISYTGRKSGQTFTLPVAYRRTGDTVTIQVGIPDQKSWWRNFLGEGAPMTLQLDGADRSGHAVAHRDHRGRVAVQLELGP